VKGTSASQSGINVVPYLISNTILSIFAGAMVTALGFYTPFIMLGSARKLFISFKNQIEIRSLTTLKFSLSAVAYFTLSCQ
jgi:hypothetical protein